MSVELQDRHRQHMGVYASPALFVVVDAKSASGGTIVVLCPETLRSPILGAFNPILFPISVLWLDVALSLRWMIL